MTIIKKYICDLCKEEAQYDELYTIEIQSPADRRPSAVKHAHKACLVKIEFLPEQVVPEINRNVFLNLAAGRTAEGEDKAFLATEEGPLVDEDGDDDDGN